MHLRITTHHAFADRHAYAGGTHHAFADRGEGFCVFNDIAVAVAYALEVHGVSRVLVVDLDVHQGNGTAAIFAEDERVTTFDMFCSANYPWSTRRAASINVPLPPDTSDEAYIDTLHRGLAQLADMQPQLIVYQAGVDALAADAFGKLALSRAALGARNNAVYSFALAARAPLLITMGGGYAKPDIAPSVAAHADVFRAAAFRVAAAHAAA
jgi:acetoin utilization deacetylase AcuC-like enzyme